MKETLLALCAILAVTTARVVITADNYDTHHLLGADSCTWGPTYWCQNITTAAGCKVTKLCIKQKWEKLEVPEDRDSVCGVCKDMVEQAREQLESNQTMEDLKAVFEGSCVLIHIKPIVKECITLVDQFIPDLVETLASQMNPSVVCSVAGLCNSAHIDQMLLEHQKIKDGRSLENDELEPDECSKCYTVAAHIEHKFNNTSKQRIAERFLYMCGELSSYSDACSAIVLTYFDTIYAHLQQNLNSQNICHLSGQCVGKFHKHEDDSNTTPKVEVRPLSSVGMVEVGDDLPCKLCEQLVGHLRDLLVANTTEEEFKLVLDGLCKQTHSFATECVAIVDEYYPIIYQYLTKGLNSAAVCEMSGICPRPGLTEESEQLPLWPLLPPRAAEVGERIFNEKRENLKDVVTISVQPKKSEAEEMQLPIERMTIPLAAIDVPTTGVEGKQACAFCEYVLHYIQEAITDPKTEDKVKNELAKVCSKLPKMMQNNCEEFVDTYGDAVVAILVQEIDPSQVCPILHLCPSDDMLRLWKQVSKYDTLTEAKVEEKPSCPLCLFAVAQIYNAIRDNKTEANIEAELDKLCTHLPHSLTDECTDLVKGYSQELIELILADLTPAEICVFLKLCNAKKDPGPKHFFPTDDQGEILTNEIPNFPLHQTHKESMDDVGCVICEFAMQYVEKEMRNKKTKNEIEKVVYHICHYLPNTIKRECDEFVDEYADVIIDILSQDVTPKEVCTMMGLCKADTKQIEESVAECALCQTIISTIDKLLADEKVVQDIEEITSRVCKYVPANKQNKCVMMMEVYEQSIINILREHGDSRKICSMIGLCSPNDYLAMSSKSDEHVKRFEKWMKIGKPQMTMVAKKKVPPKKYQGL